MRDKDHYWVLDAPSTATDEEIRIAFDDVETLGEALEQCREGVKLAKDREKPYLLLGRLYGAMGKVGAAKKMFSRAVQIKPQCVEAMRELRIMNMRRGKDAVLGTGVLKKLFRR